MLHRGAGSRPSGRSVAADATTRATPALFAAPGSPTPSTMSVQPDGGFQSSRNAKRDHGTITTPLPGVVEWSKTSSYAVSRLVSSLSQVFARGNNFTGNASEGHGLLLSSDSAYIFPYASTSTSPAILTFPLPRGEDFLLGALIPNASLQQEPGLFVALPSSGQVGYWPSLNSALAPRTGIEGRVSLSSGETITRLCNAGAAGVVLATSSGRLLHVSLRDGAGKAHVKVGSLASTGGWLGVILSAASRRDIVSLRAGQAVTREQRQVLAITRRGTLSIWEVARGGVSSNRNLLEVDLAGLLAAEGMTAVLDLAAYPLVESAVLILVQAGQDQVKLLGVRFDDQAVPTVFVRKAIGHVENAQLYLPNPGQTVFIVGERDVVLCSPGQQDLPCQYVKLANDAGIVGVGIEDQLRGKRNAGVVLLTRGAGVLRFEVFDGRLLPSAAASIKSHLEQAVFFGPLDGSPLSYTPPPKKADDAALELSGEILRGQSPFLPSSASLSEALEARVKALESLAEFAGSELSSATLARLSRDAEQAFAADALWKSVNRRVSTTNIMSRLVPGSTAVTAQNTADADPVRAFFATRTDSIAQLVTAAHKASIDALASSVQQQQAADTVLEANEVILTILLSAIEFRDAHPEYRLSELTLPLWTSSNEVLLATSVQYDATLRFAGSWKDGSKDGEALRDQLVGLANANCRIMQDKVQRDKSSEGKYIESRSKWLRGLVESSRTASALEVGERYRDFRSLVEICHDQGESASDEDVVNAVIRRLEWYLHTFDYDFAAVLWQYYLDKRQYYNLLHEFPSWRHHLTRFFKEHAHPTVSWMNDVANDNYESAALALQQVEESRLDKSRVQLSIAKLCALVENEDAPVELARRIARLDKLKKWSGIVRAASADAIDADAAVELALDELGAPGQSRDEYAGALAPALARLLQNEAPSAIEAADLLSHFVQSEATDAPYFDALLILACTSQRQLLAPQAEFWRKVVWRRAILADDWVRIADTRAATDAQMRARLTGTVLFATVRACLLHNASPSATELQLTVEVLPPRQAYHADLPQATAHLSNDDVKRFHHRAITENERLDNLEGAHNLQRWFDATVRSAQDSLAAEQGELDRKEVESGVQNPEDDEEEEDYVHVNGDDATASQDVDMA